MSLASPFPGGRSHELISRKDLGGTSRVNAMVYTRCSQGNITPEARTAEKDGLMMTFFLYLSSQHSLEARPSAYSGTHGELRGYL